MGAKSNEVFTKAEESREKLDYFICGVAGALFAYLGKDFTTQNVTFAVAATELCSLSLLSLSFFFGVRRIERCIRIKNLNYELLDAAEKAGGAAEALSKGGGTFYDAQSGGFFGYDTVAARHQTHTERRQYVEPLIEQAIKTAGWYYGARNKLLILGFLALLLGKALQLFHQ